MTRRMSYVKEKAKPGNWEKWRKDCEYKEDEEKESKDTERY